MDPLDTAANMPAGGPAVHPEARAAGGHCRIRLQAAFLARRPNGIL